MRRIVTGSFRWVMFSANLSRFSLVASNLGMACSTISRLLVVLMRVSSGARSPEACSLVWSSSRAALTWLKILGFLVTFSLISCLVTISRISAPLHPMVWMIFFASTGVKFLRELWSWAVMMWVVLSGNLNSYWPNLGSPSLIQLS